MQRKSADVMSNEKFIFINTQSDAGLWYLDPMGEQIDMPITASDEEIGVAICRCLEKSRTIEDTESDYDSISAFYNIWVDRILLKHGYSDRRKLFKNMNSCSINLIDTTITISPLNHDQLEGWGSTTKDAHKIITIDANSTPVDIGKALRLAFTRCE